ncbi:MFS transporter [Rhodobacteraceae bacterium WD3A24]|nr:MFS transporter [Rhodobacteraceae bacterium WD3A24]
MIRVLAASWALLLGIGLIMVGNGMQATLMGVRGVQEGFSTFELSLITSAYFLGFLAGSRAAPEFIRRVGHVRVFAALGSFISAVFVLFPVLTDPWAWMGLRVIFGFCLAGVYVTSESWLNNAATNETRGTTLSAYMIVQMIGIISGQGMMNLGDPSGFLLFIIPSVLVSISFAPILLSVSPTPAFGTAKRMSLAELYSKSPLGCVGIFLLGGVFSALFGMASVYGTRAGLPVSRISIFIAAIFVGSLVLQYPIGWASDRIDRRRLILAVAAIGAMAAMAGVALGASFAVLIGVAFVVGGMANPLYSLLLAYTNDYLEIDDMAAASGGLLFLNGLGAITGPLITGWLMGAFGPPGFWMFVTVLMLALVAYSAWRMTQRAAIPVADTASYLGVAPTSSPVAVEAAREWAAEQADEPPETAA